jgi:hypothetical protein
MLVDRQAIFASNFNARGWSSCAFGFLVAPLLSLVFSRFCGLLHLVIYIYRLLFSRSHFVKPSRSFLINLYLWSNVCIEAVDRNEKEVIFVLR